MRRMRRMRRRRIINISIRVKILKNPKSNNKVTQKIGLPFYIVFNFKKLSGLFFLSFISPYCS